MKNLISDSYFSSFLIVLKIWSIFDEFSQRKKKLDFFTFLNYLDQKLRTLQIVLLEIPKWLSGDWAGLRIVAAL